jgi:hypothetical protein
MRPWLNHIGRQSKPFEHANRQIRIVDFPPAMAVTRRARIGVMVVVPAFAVGDEADNDVVAAVLAGLKAPITPQMRHRINGPGDMPDQHRANEHAEHQDAEAGLHCCLRRFARQPAHEKSGGEKQRHLQKIDPDQAVMTFQRDVKTVAQDVLGVALVNS